LTKRLEIGKFRLMENSNEYIRFNVLQGKIEGLRESVSHLRAENDQLKQESASWRDEVSRLKEQSGGLEDSSAHYLIERDDIKDRVERLIQMLGE
jgi:uncharacterized coiled-coil DUF342 family protein